MAGHMLGHKLSPTLARCGRCGIPELEIVARRLHCQGRAGAVAMRPILDNMRHTLNRWVEGWAVTEEIEAQAAEAMAEAKAAAVEHLGTYLALQEQIKEKEAEAAVAK